MKLAATLMISIGQKSKLDHAAPQEWIIDVCVLQNGKNTILTIEIEHFLDFAEII